MKNILTIILIAFAIAGCKKKVEPPKDPCVDIIIFDEDYRYTPFVEDIYMVRQYDYDNWQDNIYLLVIEKKMTTTTNGGSGMVYYQSASGRDSVRTSWGNDTRKSNMSVLIPQPCCPFNFPEGTLYHETFFTYPITGYSIGGKYFAVSKEGGEKILTYAKCLKR